MNQKQLRKSPVCDKDSLIMTLPNYTKGLYIYRASQAQIGGGRRLHTISLHTHKH